MLTKVMSKTSASNSETVKWQFSYTSLPSILPGIFTRIIVGCICVLYLFSGIFSGKSYAEDGGGLGRDYVQHDSLS